jgi:hypothetical protein
VDEAPFLLPPRPDADGLHEAAASGSPVAGADIDMGTIQAEGAMIAKVRPAIRRYDGIAAMAADEGIVGVSS